MDQILEFLSRNFIFVIIALLGIFSTFKGKENEEETKKAPPVRRTDGGNIPSSARDVYREAREVVKRQQKNYETGPSAEQLRKDQIEQLEKTTRSELDQRYRVSNPARDSRLMEREKSPHEERKRINQLSKVELRRKLKEQNLVNNIIVTELLQKPRALRPFSEQRYNRKTR